MVAVSQIFERVKSVALWSANIRKLAKNHKGHGSAATKVHELSKYNNIFYNEGAHKLIYHFTPFNNFKGTHLTLFIQTYLYICILACALCSLSSQ